MNLEMNMRTFRCAVARQALVLVSALMAIACVGGASAAEVGRAISPAGDLNLTTFDVDADGDFLPNNDEDFVLGNETFSALGDMFGLGQRGAFDALLPLSAGNPANDPYPFAIQDDTLNGMDSDNNGFEVIGIIKGGTNQNITDTDPFFGVSDTVNGDTSDPQAATWLFTFPSAPADALQISIDMAAMGNFEATTTDSDFFDFEVSLDNGPFTPLFTSSVDEDASQTYIMEDGREISPSNPDPNAGTSPSHEDPLLMDGVLLSNEFQTFTKNVGSATTSLMLRFTARTNSGSEAFAFRNILIEDGIVPGGIDGDYNGDDKVDAADYVIWRKNEGTMNTLPNDPHGGTIGQAQYDTWVANFGGMAPGSGGGSAGVVPEPASAALLLIGLAALISRRRVA